MVDAVGEDEVSDILSDFSCPVNHEIENFVKNNAIDFAKRKMSITHLVLNKDGKLVAIFTLTHKALELGNENLSSTTQKKIMRYAHLNQATNSYMVSAFLIAQFSKNYANGKNFQLSGDSLMESSMNVLRIVQREVGGGIVYLECENKPQLLSFYQNTKNTFRVFNERYSGEDNVKYIQLLRFF